MVKTERKIEIQECLSELLETQQDIEKCAFDTLNQSDMLLNLVKDGMLKITQLLIGMEAAQEELQRFYENDSDLEMIFSSQQSMIGEIGQIFQQIYDYAEAFNMQSHENEEMVFEQEELISEMAELLDEEL